MPCPIRDIGPGCGPHHEPAAVHGGNGSAPGPLAQLLVQQAPRRSHAGSRVRGERQSVARVAQPG
eukprot:6475073-Alexandrium_andersonii.AAC.1